MDSRNVEAAAPEARRMVYAAAALVLVSLSAASSYFAYDVVSPLGDLLERELSLSSSQVNMLYSIYSIPVIFLVVAGGVLADRLGVRKASILFSLLFSIGAGLTAVGSFPVMLIGRLVFGVGAECFYVVMNKIMAKWYKNRMLALAFGVNLFLCRAGTYLAFFGLPRMVEAMDSWRTVILISALISACSVLFMLIYTFIDRRGEALGMTSIVEEESSFKLADVLRLPAAFWVISCLCMVYYSAIFPFTAVAPRFFQEQYGLSREDAGSLTGLLTLISMCSTWAFGVLVDKTGKRATMMIIGSVLMLPCHGLLLQGQVSPWILMSVLGLSFSLVPAALWPAIPVLVDERMIGTAYGVTAMLQNIGLFACPLVVGMLRDTQGNYSGAMLFFTVISAMAIVLSIWLKRLEGALDRRSAVAKVG